jgi:hypothetical protein
MWAHGVSDGEGRKAHVRVSRASGGLLGSAQAEHGGKETAARGERRASEPRVGEAGTGTRAELGQKAE